MLEPSIGPWLTYCALREHHLPMMRHELKIALLRRAWGQSVGAIAASVSVSRSTAKGRVSNAMAELFDTLSVHVDRDGYAAGTWVSAHLGCCLHDAQAEVSAEPAA